MLLYPVTKNLSFSDGNKRIADSTLLPLRLMIAESRKEEKDVMVKVVVNLIKIDNDGVVHVPLHSCPWCAMDDIGGI